MSIFGTVAQQYHNAGLSVMPLQGRTKKPLLDGWQRLATTQATQEEIDTWIENFPSNNIGLATGPASNVIIIDIDTENPELEKALIAALPPSPWTRVGKKGCAKAYRYSGETNTNIKGEKGMIVELLSKGRQVVLPPSIHPDTGKPYTSNVDLWEVVDQLIPLPADIIDKFRQICMRHGEQLSGNGSSKNRINLVEFMPAGHRDTSLTERAGLLAFAVLRGDVPLQIAIQSINDLERNFTEHVVGDDIVEGKGIELLTRFILRDINDKGKILPQGWDDNLDPIVKEKWNLNFGEDAREWTFLEMQDFLHRGFTVNAHSSAQRGVVVEQALIRISRSPSLSELDKSQIFQYIVDVGGLGVKLTSLKQRLKELKNGKIQGTDHNQIAQQLLKDLQQYMRVGCYNDLLWKFNGSHWEQVNPRAIKAQISRDFGHLDGCKKHNDVHGIYQLAVIHAEALLLNEPVKGINFANGFLTENNVLLQHHPEHYLTYTLPYRYMPELATEAPLFMAFLEQSWGCDPDYQQKVDALQEVIAVMLFGMATLFQKAVLLFGEPKSGKSQLLHILQNLVPDDSISFISPQDWGDKYLPAEMEHKLLNVAGELSEQKFIEGMQFKGIVDGSPITIQKKFGQPRRCFPSAMQLFASNHYPRSQDFSEGFMRRWLVLAFNRPVPVEKRQLGMGQLIVEREREAIVAWAAPALARVKANRDYTLPASHLLHIQEISNQINNVRMFVQVSGKLVINENAGILPEKTLYDEYCAWVYSVGGIKALSVGYFRSRLREMATQFKFKVVVTENAHGGSEYSYQGIALAPRVKAEAKVSSVEEAREVANKARKSAGSGAEVEVEPVAVEEATPAKLH